MKILADVIRDPKEPTVGGSPQMVMLRKDQATPIGFWWNPRTGAKAQRFLFGQPVQFGSAMRKVSWSDENFADRPFKTFKRAR